MVDLGLRLHDTLTQTSARLVPRPDGVGVYCCGPTTYDVAHVGHARSALVPDILVRTLRNRGLKVTYVRNITDVDDKIVKRATELGEEPLALSSRFAEKYKADMIALGCVAPDVEPKVSESIPEIVAIIERLIERGAAYVVDMPSGTRDVYYAVRSFEGYGKLSKRHVEELRVGARIEPSEVKHDPLDFALWKGCAPASFGFESPWGHGRPGWHIECSAMAERFLGFGFDVHTGGMDLVFPHHENEIAQSEAARPGEGPFARIWIHNGFVNVDKEKMAKSLGNFVTVQQAYDRNDPEALRLFLLGVHYRGPIAFETEKLPNGRVVFPGICEAERRLDYMYLARTRLTALAGPGEPEAPKTVPKDLAPFAKLAEGAKKRVEDALDEDLNTPVALAVIGEVAKAANELADLVQKRRKDAALVAAAPWVAARLLAGLRDTTEPLGLLPSTDEAYRERTQKQRLAVLGMTVPAVEGRLADRASARDAKDFARADAIRKALEADGVEVADGPSGTTWRLGV